MDNEKITINKNGQEIECDILFTFDCDELSKTYIGYTDNTKNEKGEDNIYVSSIDILGDHSKLNDVTTQEEWDMINDVMKELMQGGGE